MCGIIGCFDKAAINLLDELRAMLPLIAHRGPDGSGVWIDQDSGIAFGHARLAIVDLSPEGHQPKVSSSGRYVITFNGEIFNFKELSRELSAHGHIFRGSGDTEVMLAAFEQWGISGATKRFVGMFAYAVWDRAQRELTIVRDRFGIKPLYYGWLPRGGLCFGSDLHSLRGHSRWSGIINRSALAQMVNVGYVPTPHSIYEGFFKLPPGTLLTLSDDALNRIPDGFSPYGVPIGSEMKSTHAPLPYWSASEKIRAGVRNPFPGGYQEAVLQYEKLLEESISIRMIADVPLGAFLSGGVDSSLVVALMQRLSSNPVRTFCIGSHDPEFDESGYAREVARHLGTEHTELRLSESDLLSVIPRIPRIFDEPFGDSSQIPTLLVSQLARSQVTVSLSGDGGDELFCGYSRFSFTANFWRTISRYPASLRNVAYLLRRFVPTIAASIRMNKVAAKMDRALQLAPHRNLGELYESILGFWERDSGVVQGVPSIDRLVPDLKEMDPNTLPDPETFLMYADTVTYLPDDILTKVDRASMAVSLEARVPLLDHRLTEFVWTLPTSFKITPEGVTKRIMRDVLYKYVPRELIERPKKGFSIPVSSWLRTTLKEWALDLLSSETIKKEGIFNPSLVETFLNEHMQGLRDRDAALWNIIQCRSWLHEVAAAPTPISTPSTPKIVKAEEYRQDRALGVPHAS